MQMWQPPSVSDGRARRRKIFYPTTIEYAGAAVRTHLLDLSASGALGHALDVPVVGSSAHVQLGATSRAARVVWAKGNRFGLTFAIPFTEAQIADVLEHLDSAG